MRAAFAAASALVVACALAAPPAFAQEREGLWFGAGGGYGSTDVNCEDCGETDREGSGVGYLRGGWTLNERTLIGAEFSFWRKTVEDQDVEGRFDLYWISGAVTFYPMPANGFFVKGGVGLTAIDAEMQMEGLTVSADLGRGIGFVVGTGYDIRLSRRISLTPAVGYSYGRPGDLTVGDEVLFTDATQNLLEVTVGITFH